MQFLSSGVRLFGHIAKLGIPNHGFSGVILRNQRFVSRSNAVHQLKHRHELRDPAVCRRVVVKLGSAVVTRQDEVNCSGINEWDE